MTKYRNDDRKGGINLASNDYWVPMILRTNLLFQARPLHPDDTGATWNSDADGNPQDYTLYSGAEPNGNLWTIILDCDEVEKFAPNGTYVFKHKGTCETRINGASGWESSTGRTEFYLDWSSLNKIILNVRKYSADFEFEGLYLPGYEDVDEWHPKFLETLEPYAWIRFMDLLDTNNSDVVNAADIRPKTYYTQSNSPMPSTGGGTDGGNDYKAPMSIEWMVDLCNAAKMDMWICFPHQATEALVEAWADYISANLDGDLRCHVEYSNECWNGIFSQEQYCIDQGMARNLHLPDDQWRGAMRFYAERSEELYEAFRDRWPASQQERVLQIRASQNTVEWRFNLCMDWDKATQAELTPGVDVYPFRAMSPAPYSGNNLSRSVPDLDEVDEALDALDDDSEDRHSEHTPRNAQACRDRGVEFMSYEGGQHLTGSNDTEKQLWVDANRDHRMERIYKNDLERWTRYGGGRYTFFSSCSRYSSANGATPEDPWGIIEYTGQQRGRSAPPKWRAITNWLAEQEA